MDGVGQSDERRTGSVPIHGHAKHQWRRVVLLGSAALEKAGYFLFSIFGKPSVKSSVRELSRVKPNSARLY
jgi:hypothetical protein